MWYTSHLKSMFMPLLLSRAIPVAGITLLFSLVAHKSSNGLAVFAYTLAIYSVISALFSMCLSATGNIAVKPSSDPMAPQRVFSSGWCLSLVIAIVGTLAALTISRYASFLPGAQHIDGETLLILAILYIACIPLTVINTFLHLFHESSGWAISCTKIKTTATVTGCIFLGLTFYLINANNFLFMAMGYFALTELITFLALTRLSLKRALRFQLSFFSSVTKQTLALGLPIAVGLGGQKIYFYLLNERMATLNLELVAQLAVFMTIVGLLLIPYMSLSQAHSLYISKAPDHRIRTYGYGLLSLAALTAALLLPGLFLGNAIFALVGGFTLAPSPTLLAVLLLFIVSNGLVSLTMGHLRGLQDTLAPQLIVNLAIFFTLVPVFYLITPEQPSLTWYMAIQSLALLCIWAVLTIRILIIHRRKNQPIQEIQNSAHIKSLKPDS